MREIAIIKPVGLLRGMNQMIGLVDCHTSFIQVRITSKQDWKVCCCSTCSPAFCTSRLAASRKYSNRVDGWRRNGVGGLRSSYFSSLLGASLRVIPSPC